MKTIKKLYKVGLANCKSILKTNQGPLQLF